MQAQEDQSAFSHRPTQDLSIVKALVIGFLTMAAALGMARLVKPAPRPERTFVPAENGMGPRFNALADDDKAAVIFAIITRDVSPNVNIADLDVILTNKAELYALSSLLPNVRRHWREAQNSSHPQHGMVSAAQAIAAGHNPDIISCLPDSGHNKGL